MRLPTLRLPLQLSLSLPGSITDTASLSTDVATLCMVRTEVVEEGWSVSETAGSSDVVGFICDHEHCFGVRFAGEREQPHSFDSFDSALDFFAEYAWASRLGR